VTNGAAFMMLWMYISEPLRNTIREATQEGIQSVYFDGSARLPFKVAPFEERFEKYLLGELGKGRTTVVPSQLPPLCVCSEHILYNAIANCKETVGVVDAGRRAAPYVSAHPLPSIPRIFDYSAHTRISSRVSDTRRAVVGAAAALLLACSLRAHPPEHPSIYAPIAALSLASPSATPPEKNPAHTLADH